MLTTTIGAYPKPDAVPIRDWFGMEGGTDTAERTAGYAETLAAHAGTIEEILDGATREVVAEQVEFGIDIPTDGEIRRENFIHYHCRHLVGIDFETLSETRTRGDRQVLLPTITGPIQAGAPFLVRDWQIAQSATRRPVKLTVPGPLTIGERVADDHYRDPRLRGAALADALNVEIRRLADAGCPFIQVDEPAFTRNVEDALAFGIEHLERCFHKVTRSTERVVHVCCGYPDRLDAEDYPKAPQSAYFELATTLDEAEVDAVSIEDAHRPNDLGLLERFAGTKVLLGVIASGAGGASPAKAWRVWRSCSRTRSVCCRIASSSNTSSTSGPSRTAATVSRMRALIHVRMFLVTLSHSASISCAAAVCSLASTGAWSISSWMPSRPSASSAANLGPASSPNNCAAEPGSIVEAVALLLPACRQRPLQPLEHQ